MKAGTFKTNSLNIKIGKENKGNKNQLILKIGATSRFKKRKSHIMNISTFNNILNRINPEKNNIISLISKDPSSRTLENNKQIGNYLSNNYNFFKKLKKEDEEKYEVIISILHLKRYLSNDIIINYENTVDKIYFLLEGKLSIFKPIFIQKLMSPEKFNNLLSLLYNKENINKYNRIKDKNKETIFESKNSDNNKKKKMKLFYVEEDRKIDKIEEGKKFGNELDEEFRDKKSDIMVKSDEESIVIYFNIDYYKKILNKIERTKYREEIEKFRNDFILFKYFSDMRMFEIFKYLKSEIIYQDEYLYHQNEKSDYIYFITKGKFSKYISFSFNWLSDYLNYIKDSTSNIIYHLIKFYPKNQVEHDDLIFDLQKKVIVSPMIFDDLSKLEKLEILNFKKSVYGIKLEEENINKNKIFDMKIKNIEYGDMTGYEDGLEFKNRFCSVKCVSKIGEIKKIKIYDFLKIIKINKEINNISNQHFLDLISKHKFFIYNQIIKNAQKLEIILTSNFDAKYEDLINFNENKNKKINEKDKNLSIAAIKAKGYKYGIKEVFDKEIPIFPKFKKSLSDNHFLKNQKILKNLYQNSLYKSKKNFKFKNQKTSLTLSINNSNNLSLNKFNFSFGSNYTTSENKKEYNINIINILKKRNKKLNIKSIETSLNEKFENNNKKYYLGNQFKKKLDEEKKKFNLIQYKIFFNK